MYDTIEDALGHYSWSTDKDTLVISEDEDRLITLSEQENDDGGTRHYTLRRYLRYSYHKGQWDCSIDVDRGTAEEVLDFLFSCPDLLREWGHEKRPTSIL
jgi:hypothetical protein